MANVEEEMASRSDGVQQLLIAEKRASEKVGEARKRMYFCFVHLLSFSYLTPWNTPELLSILRYGITKSYDKRISVTGSVFQILD